MAAASRQPIVETEERRFPFDLLFQQTLLRLLCEDYVFGVRACAHLRPEYFEHEILGWMYSAIARYVDEYGAPPSVMVLHQMTKQLDPSIVTLYSSVVEQVRQADLRDADWLKDQVLEFVRRNLFVRAFQEGRTLYNTGKQTQAYDFMMDQMSTIDRTTWDPIDRSFPLEELPQAMALRREKAILGDAIPTGFPWLDHILGGGLHIGELGVWLAYAKVGKTTMLIQHGMAAIKVMMPVLHVVLEGSRALIENRYHSGITGELYANVKAGQMSAQSYHAAMQEYEWMRGMLVIRSFVDKWDVNILDIDQELRDLKRSRGFDPKLIVVDYMDLMTGRDKKYYRNETESQRAAYRDGKRLAGRGYALWTAAQAQRPKKEDHDTAAVLTSSSAADTYEKVRACDFWGSLNQTNAERSAALKKDIGHYVMRVHAEMYRDNPAGLTLTMASDPDHMRIWQAPGIESPSDPSVSSDPDLAKIAVKGRVLTQSPAFGG